MTEEKLSIAVVDDDPSVLRSLARLLSCQGYDATTHLSVPSFLGELDRICPDCIIADLAMPELTGLDLQRELEKSSLDYPMVFITGHGDIRSSVQAMRGGAVDFLVKPFEPDDLLEAVQRALAKSRALREHHKRMGLFRSRLSLLTRRERQVFERVVDGRLNKQIAAELGITEKTVKVHRARVMQKMAVRSVVHLARIAEQIGTPAAH